MPIRLVAGLGNPGPRYQGTRHNVGFLLLDRLAGPAAAWKGWKGAGQCLAPSGEDRPFWLVRPLTYMNESGSMVAGFAAYHKLPPADVLVCFDELALPLARLRLRAQGSSGGHNGMQSVLDACGTEQVPRLRVGIGPLPPGRDPAEFVLSPFSPAERAELERGLACAAEAALLAAREGMEAAMNRYNPAESQP